ENRTLSSWWLMPFAKSAKVELHNGSDVAIEGGSAEITASRSPRWRGGLASGEIGYFRATAVRSEAELGKDHVFLDATGRGRVVGVTQTVEGLDAEGWRRGYLEGDERVFVDGSRSPDLHGTGTEDFYEGGWYFNRGAFTAPMTGSPVPDRDDCPAACTGMYRLMLAEGIDFGSSIRFGIEHGPGDDQPAIEASTTYWYGQRFGRLHWTDGLDVGDADSEAAHAYTSEAPGEVQEGTSRFEGLDGPAEPVTLDTRATDAAVRFRLAIDRDNTGVVLRRTSDQTEGFQAARVTIDGADAGVWSQPLANPDLRWLDDSHVLPPALTRGKSSIVVTLTPVEGSPAWTADSYAAVSIQGRYSDRKPPEAVEGFTAEAGEFTTVSLGWKAAGDDVYAPMYEVHASTTAGFEPGEDTLIAVTRTPGFVHDARQVRAQWFYRVRAVDASGRSGPFSPELEVTTGDTMRIEAESLLPPVSATAPVQLQGDCCGVVWSGNAQLWFTPTTAGQHVTVEFDLNTAGTYAITAQQTLARDYGINVLSLDGERIGDAFDAYNSPDVILSEPLSYGTHEITAGKHTLTLTVPDKNPSAESYMAGLDYLQLSLTE
ncbi:MAG TPA: glycoside hydrolase family 172 protein, partial [Actinopolymorphaceae bacterium]